MAQKLSQIPLAYDPGTDWSYSVSIDVLGRVIEIVSGKSLDEFLRKTIFEPLGMVDTGIRSEESHLRSHVESLGVDAF